jgi:hypothetical protein
MVPLHTWDLHGAFCVRLQYERRIDLLPMSGRAIRALRSPAGYRFIVMRPGYASVVPAPGSSVDGMRWRVTPRDMAALNACENLDGGLYLAVSGR